MSFIAWWNGIGKVAQSAVLEREPAPIVTVEPIVISEKNALLAGKQVAASLQRERKMLDLMTFWMENNLESMIQEVLSNTTYHYTLIDAMWGTEHEWMNDLNLLEPFARAMWQQGFAVGSPDPESEYCRMVISLRTAEKAHLTWEQWRKSYFDRKRQRRMY